MAIDLAHTNIENEHLLFDILQEISCEHGSVGLHRLIDQLRLLQMQNLSHSIDPKSISFIEFFINLSK